MLVTRSIAHTEIVRRASH